ncbi:MAG: alpha/beta hydrolase [Clostridiales bacterium]|nr:alpha/beta hydrolase [Clostridiales bacterium]
MENVKLWKDGETPYFEPSYGQPETDMTPFIAPVQKNEDGSIKKTGCVIVCAGGSYEMRADHEGGDVAEMYANAGISSFVLNYRVKPYHHPAITEDISRAVRWVRCHADEYNIDPEKIAVCGFSAGGHLATYAATHFDYGKTEGDEVDRVSSRPNAAVLCYPVVSLLPPNTHLLSRHNLLGDRPDENMLAHDFSGEFSITRETPPMFMWHNADDRATNPENSLNLAAALSAGNISFELHIFPSGGHGVGLANGVGITENIPGACQWSNLAVDWLRRMGF